MFYNVEQNALVVLNVPEAPSPVHHALAEDEATRLINASENLLNMFEDDDIKLSTKYLLHLIATCGWLCSGLFKITYYADTLYEHSCINEYRQQCPDTKAMRKATERSIYNASNDITRVKPGGAHGLA
ncbi:hypothetical protein EDD85DRAFT_787025 [Armillaria nabsnona]|nr:hypothetical protein EDD85DRAFT_787025 [Armillaria nabsnona]